MGFEVSEGIIKPDPHKIDVLRKTPTSTSCADLKAYLGVLQLSIIICCSSIIIVCHKKTMRFSGPPLYKTHLRLRRLQRDAFYKLTQKAQKEQKCILTPVSLQYICIVATQNGKIVACSSKVLNLSQCRWATIEKKLYAAVWISI